MFSNERKYVDPYGRGGKKELESIEGRKPLCEKKIIFIKRKKYKRNLKNVSMTPRR